MSDFIKGQIRKSPVFSEGARAVSVKNSDLGQTTKNLDSVYPSVKLEFRKNQNPSRSNFQWGVMQFFGKKSDLGQTTKNLDSVRVDLDRVGPDLSVCEVKIQKKSKP